MTNNTDEAQRARRRNLLLAFAGLVVLAVLVAVVLVVLNLSSGAPMADANTAFNEGNYEEAVDLYTQELDANADNREAYVNRGMAYLELDQNGNARADFQQAIEMDPEAGPRAYYGLGTAQRRLDQADAALENYNRALELAEDDSPLLADIYWRRGRVYHLNLEDFDAAIADYRQAIDEARGEDDDALVANTYLGLGNIYYEQEQYDEALDAYRQYAGLAGEQVAGAALERIEELEAGPPETTPEATPEATPEVTD